MNCLVAPKSTSGYGVSFRPVGKLYFSAHVRFPDTPGLGPVQADMELVGGILAKGRITHAVTGKPIPANGALQPSLPQPVRPRLRPEWGRHHPVFLG